MKSFIAELRRRNVFRAGALYVASVWAIAQGIAQLGPSVGAPEWATRWFIVAGVIGLPFFLAFAWFYEITPQGLKRESDVDATESITRRTGKVLDRLIIAVLAVAVVLLLTHALVSRDSPTAATQVAADTAAPVPVADKSIAVLPFVDLSEAKDQEYFSDGISEELLSLLSQVPELRVIGRTSSFQFKDKSEDLRVIAQKLGVANLLEGSVRKSGNRIRISTRLVRADDGSDLWSETYDRTLDDIFSVQDDIAGEVVKSLKITLLGAAPKTRQTNPEAYALFLQARQLARQYTPGSMRQSDDLYEKALAIDPTYAPAWDELAVNGINGAGMGMEPFPLASRRARERVEKALDIDPEYAPAHASLGSIAMYSGNLAEAATHLERALTLAPGDRDVRVSTANLLRSLGRLDEAIGLLEYVVARDPIDAGAITNLGNLLEVAGRLDEALPLLQTSLRLNPTRVAGNYSTSRVLLRKGQPEAALAAAEQETDAAFRLIGTAMAYDVLGRKAEAGAALAQLEADHRTEAPYNIAYVYGARGDADRAFLWLDRAVEYEDPGLSEIVTEPFFAKLHDDPRWLPFLRKRGVAPEQLAAIKFDVKVAERAEKTSPAAGGH